MDEEVGKLVDRALREMIADLIVTNTELKARVMLLTAKIAQQEQTNADKNKSPPLKAVKD